ncbi:hypothetical protein AB0G49_09155 [Streptomyces longwoodensis]|uniref:hypothetical protein n=1 Tax=Streptomyces longwoodensis TaxID=68231 RepID=UPI0033C2791D
MGRLGWTMEQRAGVRQYFRITTFFAILGIVLGVVLISVGNTGGWLLLAISTVGWIGMYVTLKNIKKAQP